MKKILPFLIILVWGCGKETNKPDPGTPPGNPKVSITNSQEVGSTGTGFRTAFEVTLDLSNAKSIAYINLVDETDPVQCDPIVKPDKPGPWIIIDKKHPYATNNDTYHLFVKLTDSTSFNTPQYKCH